MVGRILRSPLAIRRLAQSRHCHRAERCPLLGVKRTSTDADPTSAFDPKRTSVEPNLPVTLETATPCAATKSLQRLEGTHHSRNKLRHCGMNVHRALHHRVGRLGVHNIE